MHIEALHKTVRYFHVPPGNSSLNTPRPSGHKTHLVTVLYPFGHIDHVTTAICLACWDENFRLPNSLDHTLHRWEGLAC